MEHSDFVVKCYNKQELAQMYFPDLTIRASVNKLRRWMRRCKPLMNEILSTDFHPKTKAFSVREVRLITYYLGKPGGTINDINIKKNYGRLHFRELP
ncbi:DUF4248 domain-containing protein [Bacteroides ovatus]|nr:DUF4248 domain-containing protein [Bacteroides ovatus]